MAYRRDKARQGETSRRHRVTTVLVVSTVVTGVTLAVLASLA
ncbi:MAG: hypothetical protein VYD64_07100 [Pseudomonadota bacterium]|nr:hypothetical protein [Pseudomonadota bacterium]